MSKIDHNLIVFFQIAERFFRIFIPLITMVLASAIIILVWRLISYLPTMTVNLDQLVVILEQLVKILQVLSNLLNLRS